MKKPTNTLHMLKNRKKKVFKVSIIGASSSNYGFYIKKRQFLLFYVFRTSVSGCLSFLWGKAGVSFGGK